MRVIGIDPGKSGAWCLLEYCPFDSSVPHGMKILKLQALPTKLSVAGKTEIDADSFLDQLSASCVGQGRSDLVVLEKITPRPVGNSKHKQEHVSSGQSLLSFGITLGKIKAVLEIIGLPVKEVAPQTWKAAILRDTDKSKEAAIGTIMNLFPGVDLRPTPRHKPSHDWAESVCMALYGLRLLQKGSV